MTHDAPVRVAYFHPGAGLYGAEQSMLVTLRHLDRAAFTPEVLLPEEGPLVAASRAAGAKAHALPWLAGARSNRRRTRLATAIRLAIWLRRHQIGLVHLNMWENGDGGTHLIAAKLAGAGYLLGIRCRMDDYLDRSDQFWLSRMRLILSVSREAVEPIYFRRPLDRFWHVRPEQVSVIPPGRDLAAMRSAAPAPDAALEALGLRADRPIVGSVAALNRIKRPELFLRAAALVAAADPEAQFLLIGESYSPVGPDAAAYVAGIHALATELGLAGRVAFAGFRTDAVALMKRMKVLAVTSVAEGHCGVAIEAVTVGVPVVASTVGGTRELLADSRLGTLIGSSDPADYAAAILQHLSGVVAHDRSWDAATAASIDRYDAVTTTRELEAFYRQLLSR